MVVTPSGISRAVNARQYQKELSGSAVKPADSVIFSSFSQSKNTPQPIEVRESGRMISVRPLLLKALPSSVVSPAGSVSAVRLRVLANASVPIRFTESGSAASFSALS